MKKIAKYVMENELILKIKREINKTNQWNKKIKKEININYDLIDKNIVEKHTSLLIKDIIKNNLKIEDVELSCYNKDTHFIRYNLYLHLEMISKNPNQTSLLLKNITHNDWQITNQNMNTFWFVSSIYTFREKIQLDH